MIKRKTPDLVNHRLELTGGSIKVAFRKDGTSIYSKIIKAWPFGGAKGPYSHCEVLFSNGWSWSSDETDSGTRFKKITYTSGWDFLEIPCSLDDERRLWKFCESENGLAYDKRGIIFSFLPIPIGWQHENKWFCSEAVTAVIQLLHYLSGYSPASIAPSRLYKLLSVELTTK